jgi:hypothetical protein
MVSELNTLRLIRDKAQLEYTNACQTCHESFSILCNKGYMHLYGATFMANADLPFEIQLEIKALYEGRTRLSYALYEAKDNYESAYLQFNEFTNLCVKFQGYIFNLANIRSVEYFEDVIKRPYFILGLCLHHGGNFEQDPLYHLVEELDSFIDQEHDGNYTYTYTYNFKSSEESSDEESPVVKEPTMVKFMREKNAKIEFLKQQKKLAEIGSTEIGSTEIGSNNNFPERDVVKLIIKEIINFFKF